MSRKYTATTKQGMKLSCFADSFEQAARTFNRHQVVSIVASKKVMPPYKEEFKEHLCSPIG